MRGRERAREGGEREEREGKKGGENSYLYMLMTNPGVQ